MSQTGEKFTPPPQSVREHDVEDRQPTTPDEAAMITLATSIYANNEALPPRDPATVPSMAHDGPRLVVLHDDQITHPLDLREQQLTPAPRPDWTPDQIREFLDTHDEQINSLLESRQDLNNQLTQVNTALRLAHRLECDLKRLHGLPARSFLEWVMERTRIYSLLAVLFLFVVCCSASAQTNANPVIVWDSTDTKDVIVWGTNHLGPNPPFIGLNRTLRFKVVSLKYEPDGLAQIATAQAQAREIVTASLPVVWATALVFSVTNIPPGDVVVECSTKDTWSVVDTFKWTPNTDLFVYPLNYAAGVYRIRRSSP